MSGAAAAGNTYLGWKPEATYGTIVAPDQFGEYNSESLRLDVERLDNPGLRFNRNMMHDWQPGRRTVDGEIEMLPHPVAIGSWLKLLMGAPATTGSNAPYTHTYTPGNIDDLSMTVQVVRPEVSGTRVVCTYPGIQVMEAEFSSDIGEYLSSTWRVIGRDEDRTQSIATPTYPAGDPFTFVHGSVSLGGSAFECRAVNLTVSNPLDEDRFFTAASDGNLRRQATMDGMRAVTGTLEIGEFRAADYNRYPAGTDVALVATYQAGTGAGLTELQFSVNARIDQPSDGTVQGPEMLTLGLPFTAYSGTSDANALTITLKNGASSVA